MSKEEVTRWLDTLPAGATVVIDEGGLSIVEIDTEGHETGAYCEIGCAPEKDR